MPVFKKKGPILNFIRGTFRRHFLNSCILQSIIQKILFWGKIGRKTNLDKHVYDTSIQVPQYMGWSTVSYFISFPTHYYKYNNYLLMYQLLLKVEISAVYINLH